MSIGLFDRKGVAELLKLPVGAYQLPRLSPDGKRLAFGTDWVGGIGVSRHLLLSRTT